MRFNTDKFNTIVRFFGLQKAIDYFLLYNDTKFMNGYHGYEHMKRTVCSVFYLSKFYKVNYTDTESLLYAAIFHDFNYLGTNKEDPEYDKKNVEAAYEGFYDFRTVCPRFPYAQEIRIRNLIYETEYPHCLKSDIIDSTSSILIDADLSMVLYDGAPLHQFLYYVFDFNGEINYESFQNNAIAWSRTCKFGTQEFSRIWEEERDSILSDTLKYLDDCLYNPNYIICNSFENRETRLQIFCDKLKNSEDFRRQVFRDSGFEYI